MFMTEHKQQQQQQQEHEFENEHNMKDAKVVRARMVPVSDLEQCGKRLRDGDLVAFPTETVYGLGCAALDPTAIVKVFQAKERPLSDPLITHVTRPETAYELWERGFEDLASSSAEGRALHALCERFWPGPLTIVAKARNHVPDLLMANTGYVACRSPKHITARALIEAAGTPIAAPSANKFGHVSPTRSQHVWDDLQYEDVWIVEEPPMRTMVDHNGEDDAVCEVGVESSVVKIETTTTSDDDESTSKRGKVTLLRQGAVSAQDIEACLNDAGLGDAFVVATRTKNASDETVAQVAPGQTIRHYSPHIASYILAASACPGSDAYPLVKEGEQSAMGTTILIDFGGKLKAWELQSLAYRDLSQTGDSSVATKNVFQTLRWAERIEGATRIIFPEISEDVEEGQVDALTLALKDRLTRAASGVVIDSLSNEKRNEAQ